MVVWLKVAHMALQGMRGGREHLSPEGGIGGQCPRHPYLLRQRDVAGLSQGMVRCLNVALSGGFGGYGRRDVAGFSRTLFDVLNVARFESRRDSKRAGDWRQCRDSPLTASAKRRGWDIPWHGGVSQGGPVG
jgi:hypothetical protein